MQLSCNIPRSRVMIGGIPGRIAGGIPGVVPVGVPARYPTLESGAFETE
jgi:hypothetical protein